MSEEYITKKVVIAFKCLRCGHEWIPRVSMEELEGKTKIKKRIRICPKCKTAYWDKERTNTKKGEE